MGFACGGFSSFKLFYHLALSQQVLDAMVFISCGPCGHVLYFASGLTRRSSRPAYCGRLILSVSPITRSMRAPTCSSAPPCSKGFQAFWASSACVASANSYHFCSAAPLPWPSAFSWAAPLSKAGRSLLAFGSNFALKRTGFQPAAYLGR